MWDIEANDKLAPLYEKYSIRLILSLLLCVILFVRPEEFWVYEYY